MIMLRGKLTDVAGEPIPFGLINLVSESNTGASMQHASTVQRANENGEYAFSVKTGEYLVYAQVSMQSDVEPVGKAIIGSTLGSEMSLEEALAMSEPLVPESIVEMRQILQTVRAAEKETAEIVSTVEQHAEVVANHYEEVATLSKKVSQQSEQVSQHRDEVVERTETVLPKIEQAEQAADDAINAANTASEKAQDVTSMHGDTQQWHEDVSNWHQSVHESKQAVDESERYINEKHQQVTEKANQVSLHALQVAKDEKSVTQSTEVVLQAANDVEAHAEQVESDRERTETAASTAVEKAEQVADAASAVANDESSVSQYAQQVSEHAAQVSADTESVTRLSEQVANDADASKAAAQKATEEAKRAEKLVDAANGGSLLKGANLSDVENADEARENLNAAAANDERLSNAREWTAESVSRDEAERGESTTRRAWSALRVRQAIDVVVNAAKSKLLSKAGNLSDIESATEARKNLDVYSHRQVENRLDKKVDKETKINGKPLDGDVTLSAADLDIDNAQLSESVRRMKINALLGETIYFK